MYLFDDIKLFFLHFLLYIKMVEIEISVQSFIQQIFSIVLPEGAIVKQMIFCFVGKKWMKSQYFTSRTSTKATNFKSTN